MNVLNIFKVGKTQWSKWRTPAKVVFNETRSVDKANAKQKELYEQGYRDDLPQPAKKKVDAVEVITEVAEAATSIAGTVDAVSDVVKMVKSVTKKGK